MTTMVNKVWMLVVAVALLLAGCGQEEEDKLMLTEGGKTLEVLSVVTSKVTTPLEAKDSWTATCQEQWLNVSPAKGEAGTFTLTLTATQTNRTKATRTAKVTIKSGSETKTLTVKQRDDYAVFNVKQYEVPAAGEVLNIRFKTNMKDENLLIYTSGGMEEWLDAAARQVTRAERELEIVPLRVGANTSRDSRDGALFLVMEDEQGEPLPLDTLWIHQSGVDSGYESTDYSEDGKVAQWQKATRGKGIPLVLMGDGFTDLEIQEGAYQIAMQQTVDNLFSEEPVKSLRDYFDIYVVNAVSANNVFTEESNTAFSCMPDFQTTAIRSDDDRIYDYVRKVENIDSLNALAIVVMNSNIYKGVTYLYSNDNKPGLKQYAVALFPMVDSLKSETFRSVTVHEAIGHGLAKLADEYAHDEQGAADDDVLSELRYMHGYGWMMNVDSEESEEKVIWKDFIGDSRFQIESIGVYEGGYTYFKGIYRPSEDSMMNHSESPFNAPSRWLIYKKVMEMGEGRTPTYEEFASFDEQHKPQTWHYSTRSIGQFYRRLLKNSCINWRHSSSSTPPMH